MVNHSFRDGPGSSSQLPTIIGVVKLRRDFLDTIFFILPLKPVYLENLKSSRVLIMIQSGFRRKSAFSQLLQLLVPAYIAKLT